MSFSALKKNRDAAIEKLLGAAAASSKPTYKNDDEGYWKPTLDKAGNTFAVIRFLPGAEGDDLPWVSYHDHGFKGATGRWYIEKSLTSIGQEDPVAKMNSRLWNSGIESDKEKARARKRRLHYVSNIFVVADSSNPESEGKVFKFAYGKKIHDKIMDKMQPEFQDETPINPFDFWGGANFKLKIRQVEGFRNYDKSEFDSPSELFGGDEAKLEEIYGNLYKLSEYVDPKNYKSYAELEKKLVEVLGAEEVFGSDQLAQALPTPVASSAIAQKAAAMEAQSSLGSSAKDEEEETKAGEQEDTLSYFAKLANA